jgi:AcrR family transcriptional regulator
MRQSWRGPARMPRADRSRQLLDTAEQVFAERGFQAASMDDIAERAGVTKPVLYDHFGSKDGLLAAVISRAGGELAAVTEAAVRAAAGDGSGPGDPRGSLAAGLHAYFTFLDRHASAWSVLVSETAASSAAAGELEVIRRRQGEYIAGLIGLDYPQIGPRSAALYAQAVVGACERLGTIRRDDPGLDPRTLTDHLMTLLWGGFKELPDRPVGG